MVLEKTLEGPLGSKNIKPAKENQRKVKGKSKSKENQSQRKSTLEILGRTDAETEAEAPILWQPDAKSRLIRKEPDSGKD